MTSRGISQSSNIISGVIDQLNGGGDVIGLDYAAGQKWMLYFVAKPVQSGFASGGIKVLVDLDDYAGVTAEGRDGWVTVWIDVVAGTGVGGWPIGFGVQKRTFGANAPDSPIALFDVTVNASVNSIPVDLFSINSSGGITTCDLKLGVASPLSGGGELSVHGLSFEVRKTNLNPALIVRDDPWTCNRQIHDGSYFCRMLSWLIAVGTQFSLRLPIDDGTPTIQKSS